MGFQSGDFPYKLPELSKAITLTPNWTRIKQKNGACVSKKRCFAPTFGSTAQRFSSSSRNIHADQSAQRRMKIA
jgi:hypothetical protein